MILETLPDSKMIFLVRDGRDVVDSLLDLHQRNSWYSEYAKTFPSQEERLKALEFYARLWRTRILTTKTAYEKHDQGLRLLVRYEDLRVNTSRELKRIYQFVGTEVTDDYLNDVVSKYSFEKIPETQKGSGRFLRTASPGVSGKGIAIDR